MSQTSLIPVFCAIFGSLIGSFLNVVILRLPDENQSIVLPASHCPVCDAPIHWYDNLPIISFIMLRGKCRQCHTSISWQYPLVELSMALLSLALYLKFSLSILFAIYFVYAAALLVIIFIDFKHQIIPDVISLPGIVAGFALAFINPALTWQNSAIGLLVGGGSLYAIAAGYYLITKREGMGGGDIKLLGMIGAFQGWQALPFILFASSVLGTIAGVASMLKQKKGGQTVIPYGPFLSAASLLYLFFQVPIHKFLLTLFALR